MSIWNLPSTSKFLNNLEISLREGNNVIIPTPSLIPDGLLNAIGNNLSINNYSFIEFELISSNNPLDQFFDFFNSSQINARSILSLINILPKGKIFIIKNIDILIINKWISFISDFDSSVRNISLFDRPLLIIIIPGIAYQNLNISGVAIRIFPWNNIIGDLDIQVYVNLNYPSDKIKNKFIYNLVCRIICNLSLWDFKLLNYLINLDPPDLFNRSPILYNILYELPHLNSLTKSWISGGEMLFDGSKLTHTYLLKDESEFYNEVSSRIWAAQASILFPLIEKYRRSIINKYKYAINIKNESEINVENIYDIEIGTLSFLINKSNFNNSLKNKVNKLRVIRNKLAHLEVLSYEEVDFLDPNYLDF